MMSAYETLNDLTEEVLRRQSRGEKTNNRDAVMDRLNLSSPTTKEEELQIQLGVNDMEKQQQEKFREASDLIRQNLLRLNIYLEVNDVTTIGLISV